jgi:hypothetical protein
MKEGYNKMNSELLLENKELREQNISKDYVLDKVKGLVLLPGDTYTTTEMVAEYYEVPIGTIKGELSVYADEFESDGYRVLKGKELKDFKGELGNPTNLQFVSSLAIIPRRAILRLGMILRDSIVAKKVRDYLLNVEENADVSTKIMSIVTVLKDDMDALKQYNSILVAENKELRINTYNIINKIDELLNQPMFKLYENSSKGYETLIIEFTEIMRDKDIIQVITVKTIHYLIKSFQNGQEKILVLKT